MATIDKALTLLSCFTPEQPSMKLTDLARLSGMNKAGVFRYLSGLSRAGLIEQDEETRHYRLGPEIVRLAQVRDATVPIRRWMREILSEITERTGETCHAGLTAQGRLFAYMVNDSPKSLQVRIDPGMDLPFTPPPPARYFSHSRRITPSKPRLMQACRPSPGTPSPIRGTSNPVFRHSATGATAYRRRCRHGCDFRCNGLFRCRRTACRHHCDPGTGSPHDRREDTFAWRVALPDFSRGDAPVWRADAREFSRNRP